MADKTPRHQQADTGSLDEGYERLRLSMENARNKIVTMESSIAQIVEDNKGLRQDFRALMDFLKKDEVAMDKQQELFEGGSSVHGPRSTTGNTTTIPPSTPTRFGTLIDGTVTEPVISIMSTPMSSNVQMSFVNTHPSTMVTNPGFTIPYQPFRPHYTQPAFIPAYRNTLLPYPNHTNLAVPSQNPVYTLPPFTPKTNQNFYSVTPPIVTTDPIPHSTPIKITPPPIVHNNHQQTQTQNWNYNESLGYRPSFHNTGYKPPKVDFPKFEGKDPRSWIRKCEKYFHLYPCLDDRAKVICATI